MQTTHTWLIIIVFFAFEVVTSFQQQQQHQQQQHQQHEAKEISAREKIRKHLEWLEKRAELKSKYLNVTGNNSVNIKPQKKKYFDGFKIYTPRFKNDDPRRNDVYPELDYPIFTTTISSSTKTPPPATTTTTIEVEPRQIETTTVANDLNYNSTISKEDFIVPNTSTFMSLTFPSTEIATAPTTIPATTTTTTTTTAATTIATTIFNSIEINQKNSSSTSSSSSTGIVPVNKKPIRKFKIRKYPHWGNWSKWSECSRTCGTGVMYQQRKCISKRANSGKRFISNECIGLYKRFHLCNEHDCPVSEKNFRQQQCSRYDNVDFEGTKYTWEPHIKEDAECELNCKPIDVGYFATLNRTVIDGTTCFRPAEYYRSNYTGTAICVDGICKAILSTGIIPGSFANSGTIPCGGLICRPISGIFTKEQLIVGYNHVATLPAGASNISITELKNSKNLLVLRSLNNIYAFNGNATASPSGGYDIAGTTFDYRRIDGLIDQDGKEIEGVAEWITTLGPIREPVELLVYASAPNPGIKYEYLLPIGSTTDNDEINENSFETDNEINLKNGNDESLEATSHRPIQKRRRKFQWKVVGFSPCSKSCGGGTQQPIIRCVHDGPKRFFSARRCSHTEKPDLNENLLRCNTQPCPAYWHLDDWEDCKCHHSHHHGYREREARCVQELAEGIIIQVNSAACLEDEPATRKRCECPKPIRRRTNRNRYQAHTRAPMESIIINSTIVTSSTQRYPKEIDQMGTWLVSDWNQHCSAECGTGVEYRSIFCERKNSERCDLRFTPDTTRPCENEKQCDSGEWFTSHWEQCSGNCFNLTRIRQVICIRNQLIVDDDECRLNEKPESLQNCTFNDVQFCKPRWHYSSWSDCSKKCDGGTQRRTVKCLEIDIRENTLKESTKCRYSDREPIYRSCNTEKCKAEPRVDMIQNDIAPNDDCIDEFNNCHLVVKANLCAHEYYQQNCCYSCPRSQIERF